MKKYKKESEVSYALGMTVVFELLKNRSRYATCVYLHPDVNKNENYYKLVSLCESLRVPVRTELKVFNILSPKENCFAIGEFSKYVSTPQNGENHVVLVNPMSSGNMGTIMRTALGFGYNDIAVIEPAVDVFSPETVRSSMGAVFSLRVKTYASIEEYMKEFPEHKLYPFMLTAKKSVEDAEFKKPFSLVFGNEAHGLPDIYEQLGESVIIPCTDKVDSLNLSIAAGIGMYIAKQRKQ